MSTRWVIGEQRGKAEGHEMLSNEIHLKNWKQVHSFRCSSLASKPFQACFQKVGELCVSITAVIASLPKTQSAETHQPVVNKKSAQWSRLLCYQHVSWVAFSQMTIDNLVCPRWHIQLNSKRCTESFLKLNQQHWPVMVSGSIKWTGTEPQVRFLEYVPYARCKMHSLPKRREDTSTWIERLYSYCL